MPCVVPTCGTSEGSFMLFPRDGTLSERWFEAIQIGCGILMELDEDRDLSQTEICLWHFDTDEASLEDEEDDHRYREPKLFANGVRKKRKQVNLNLVNIMKKKCYICSTVFKDANELSLHLTEMHSGKDGYHCEECSLDFPLLPAYNRHLSRHDKSERPHKCNFCPIRFKSTIQLKAHENRLHGTSHDVNYLPEQPSRIECETCEKVFSYKHKLKMHIRMVHMGSKQPSCNICHKTFTATSSLERHMLLHTNEKPHVCPNCGISFRRALLLRHHMQMEHEGRNPHVCAECQEQFKNYHQLYIHKQVVHLKKPYGGGTKQRKYHLDCKLCKSSHSKTSDLERHIKSDHPGETYPYPKCTDCPRTFLSKTHLDHHKAIHTDKYSCQECGKRNTSIQTLQTHMENAHSDVRRYDCPVCINKSYKTAVSLRQHMATHSHGKKHVCEYCQKGFVRKDHMLIHRRIHTGEKPFQCTNCLKRFNDDASFCRHRKRCLEPMAKADEDNVDDLLNFDF